MNKINTTLNKWVMVTMLTAIVTSPSFALAKSDKSNGNKNRNLEKQELKVQVQDRIQERVQERDREHASTTTTITTEKNIKKCFQAWGHLIAPGWIKWNGSATVPDNCVMPFGIGKKFKGTSNRNTTSTLDTIAPVINNLTVTPDRYSAYITWKTNELSNSTVFYGTSSPLDLGTATSKTSNLLTQNHAINISGLSSSTTYYIVIASKDSSSNMATSSQITFTTLTPIDDTVPPTISNIIATVGSTTVNVGWKTDENATTKVYYSTSAPVNLTISPFVENNTLVTTHLSSISGLSTSTTYFIVLESKDSSGNIQRSDEFSILTTSEL